MAPDISWSGPGGTFNFRAAAIIARAEEILLCTVDGLGYWFLPGGRVRLGESGEAALARELAEELGDELPAGKLALVVENICRGGTLQHELCSVGARGPDRAGGARGVAGSRSARRRRTA